LVAQAGSKPAAIFGPSEVVPTAIFPLYPATLGASKSPQEGRQNRLAVSESPRTLPDGKTPLFDEFSRDFSEFRKLTGRH
jgi:hypothetical protein